MLVRNTHNYLCFGQNYAKVIRIDGQGWSDSSSAVIESDVDEVDTHINCITKPLCPCRSIG